MNGPRWIGAARALAGTNLALGSSMDTKRQVPARRLALVVMAAGVVTTTPEFTMETAGEFRRRRLSDTLLSFCGATLGHKLTARR